MAFARRLVIALLTLCPGLSARGEPGDSGLEHFESRIRPLLSEHCYQCHSAKAEKPKGMLRLDSRRALLTALTLMTGATARLPTSGCIS